MSLSIEKFKLDLLGYKKGLEPISVKGLNIIEPIISGLPNIERVNRPEIDLETLKTGAREFYGKYFTLHNIHHLSVEKANESIEYLTASRTGAEMAEKVISISSLVSPFDLPIILTEGHSMVGEVTKPIPICTEPSYKEKLIVPFSHITLGDNLTDLSIATYIHEIAHVLTESNIGYTEDYYLKEVISIFLEKLAALELDPTQELLKTSERIRFKYLSDIITLLKNKDFLLKNNMVTEDYLLKESTYVNATLLATKLFDNYLKLRKPKDKNKFLQKIQQIFDGNLTVEQLLQSEGITIQQAKDLNLIKRHI